MYLVRALSLYNGWDKLAYEKSSELKEITEVLKEITFDSLNIPDLTKRISLSHTYRIPKIFDFTSVWNTLIERNGWKRARYKPANPNGRTFYVRNTKNKVVAQMLIADRINGPDLSTMLLVNAPRAINLGLCDVFVLLVPTDDTLELFNDTYNSLNRPLTESSCRAQIDEMLPFPAAMPVVIIFFSLTNSELSIEELPLVVEYQDTINSIEQEFQFTPESTQAGIGILSYFNEVLKQKHPDLEAKVRVEQQGNTVSLHIELPSEEVESISEELRNYFLIVGKKAKPDILFDNKLQVIAFENKLELANAEIKNNNRLYQQLYDSKKEQERTYEQAITLFQQQIAVQATQISSLIQLSVQQIASNEKIQIAQVGHSNNLFKDLLGEAHGSQVTLQAVRSLEYQLLSGIETLEAQEQAKLTLTTIQQTQPALLTKIASVVENSGYGVLGNIIYEWIKHQ